MYYNLIGMEAKIMKKTPKIVEHYQTLQDAGILEYIDDLQLENKGLKNLLSEAYEIFQKESIEELVNFVIKCLSDKFIPSSLIFILNQGIMVNRLKTLVYENLKITEYELPIKSLEPYERFFQEYSGTTSYLIFESVLEERALVAPFESFKPEIVVPVNGLSGLYGIIAFGPKVLGNDYSAAEIEYIDRITRFTSIGIQNNIHYEHSVREPKTGLYNHNFFVRRVDEEKARSRRTGMDFSIIILDIDKFKHFNDTYGHLAGDKIIMNIAGVLKQTVREEDIISRFGGEEFTILLPHTDKEAAWKASERIRTAVELMETDCDGKTLKVTISLGIAVFQEKDGRDANLLEAADRALYKSKENGRNQSSFADE